VTEIQPGNPVVATIGKDEIKRDDVIAYIKNLPVQVQQLPLDKIFPAALEQIINEKLVRINAAKVNLDSDAEVKEKLAAAKKEIVATVFLKKEIAARVTPENLEKTYKAYIASLDDVEEVKAAHILVEDEALAQELIQKLEKGADFAALAKEYSKDLVSAKNGGDIGYFAANEVVPEFAQAAFAQEVGKHSFTPVKSQFGYHIIKVEDRRKRPIPTLEEVKPILEGQIRQAALKDLFEQWRSTATIELFDINGKPVEEGKPAAPDAAKAP
jgi:peptidyl-prolyl cis-trans isomerase C